MKIFGVSVLFKKFTKIFIFTCKQDTKEVVLMSTKGNKIVWVLFDSSPREKACIRGAQKTYHRHNW